MGKSKRRILHKGINDKIQTLSRDDALDKVVSDFRNKNIDDKTKDLISLFGLNAEELLEAGATYEDVLGLKSILF